MTRERAEGERDGESAKQEEEIRGAGEHTKMPHTLTQRRSACGCLPLFSPRFLFLDALGASTKYNVVVGRSLEGPFAASSLRFFFLNTDRHTTFSYVLGFQFCVYRKVVRVRAFAALRVPPGASLDFRGKRRGRRGRRGGQRPVWWRWWWRGWDCAKRSRNGERTCARAWL